MTFIVCLIIFILNLVFFSSSSGYYWVEYVDHYSTNINIVAFSFIQGVLFAYFLPIEDLVDKVKKFGETTPKLYIFCLKYVCPALSLFLSVTAIYGDITKEDKPEVWICQLVCYTKTEISLCLQGGDLNCSLEELERCSKGEIRQSESIL